MQNTNSVFRSLSASFAATVAVALLAGCGGSQAINPAAGGASSMSSIHSGNPAVKGGCTAHGGVRVTPCTVDLTASNPGPDTVTVRVPQNKKGTLSEQDNCGGASGIATVAPGTAAGSYTVTAGATTGSCTATFSYTNKHGKVVGYADLSITNSI